MTAVVFAGPSLPSRFRVDDDEVVFAPPIKRGDIDLYEGCDPLVIIDGEFGQNLSVSPKEILAALRAGRRIIGASSMGALRASELDFFGMVGVGWIYDRFAGPAVRYDDDVALVFSPDDFEAFTVPLVNVLYSLEVAVAGGLVTPEEEREIAGQARAVFYADRDVEAVAGVFEAVIGVERYRGLQDGWGGPVLDIKEIDAIAAVAAGREMARVLGRG